MLAADTEISAELVAPWLPTTATCIVHDGETVARTAREAFKTAEKANDQVTCDLLTQRMQVHEKTSWMLRSLLE